MQHSEPALQPQAWRPVAACPPSQQTALQHSGLLGRADGLVSEGEYEYTMHDPLAPLPGWLTASPPLPIAWQPGARQKKRPPHTKADTPFMLGRWTGTARAASKAVATTGAAPVQTPAMGFENGCRRGGRRRAVHTGGGASRAGRRRAHPRPQRRRADQRATLTDGLRHIAVKGETHVSNETADTGRPGYRRRCGHHRRRRRLLTCLWLRALLPPPHRYCPVCLTILAAAAAAVTADADACWLLDGCCRRRHPIATVLCAPTVLIAAAADTVDADACWPLDGCCRRCHPIAIVLRA